jgi:hypothetical protein
LLLRVCREADEGGHAARLGYIASELFGHAVAARHLESEHGSKPGILEALLQAPVVLAQQIQHIDPGQHGQQILQVHAE